MPLRPSDASFVALLADLGRIAEADALLAERPRNRIACTAGRVHAELLERTGDRAHRARANRLFAEARREC